MRHIYQDVASATGDKSARRPELAQAIREALALKAPLIVTDIDRLTRSKIDLIEDAVKQGLNIHSVKLGGEVSSSALALETRKAEIAGRRNSKTTTDALAKMKASGVKLGSPGNKLAAAAASAKVRALRASDKVLDLADFLAADPARQSKTAKELMNLLNSGGIQTSRGKIWSVSALRRPLRKAREELKVRAELDAMPDDPDMLPGAQAQPDATYPIGHESGSSGTEVTKVKSPLEIRLQVQKQRRDKQDEAFKHIPGYGAFGS